MKKKLLFLSTLILSLGLAFTSCNNTNEPDNPDVTAAEKLPYSETFESGIGKFTEQSVKGTQKWDYDSKGKYMKMTGHVSKTEKHENEDWLISPKIDLSGVTAAKLTFDYNCSFFKDLTTETTVWVSENYKEGLPATATWQQLTVNLKSLGNWDIISSDEISLTAYAGKKINIAFKYLSTSTDAGTWEIKNFKVQEGEAVENNEPRSAIDLTSDTTTPVTSINEDFSTVENNKDITLAGWKALKVLGDRNWQGKIYTPKDGGEEEKYAQASAHKGKSADYEYWLVTPPINVDGLTSKTLEFKTAKAYWKATSSLKVFVLKNENGKTTQTDISDKAYIVKEADKDHTFVSSGTINLSSYSGTIYIGYQYVAKGGESNSTTFRVDDVVVK